MKRIIELLPQKKEVCFVIKSAFSKSFCNRLIAQKKDTFQSAHTHYPTSYRNNERQVVDNQEIASIVFSQIKKYVPHQIQIEGIGKVEKGTWELRKLNDRIRICRYKEGQYFNKHLDGVHYRSKDIQSKLTFMIYLNDNEDYSGGRTLFFNSKEDDTVIKSFEPDAGDLIIFDHNLWHSGEKVEQGEKYILRSDIIYENISSKNDNCNKPFAEGHLGYVWSIINFSNKKITAGRDRKIKIWNNKGQKINELSGHKNSIISLLALNENIMLSASRDQLIKFWKYENEQFIFQRDIKIHTATVLTLCKIDDDVFASGGGDGMINIVDVNGNVLLRWQAHQEWIWRIIKIDDSLIGSIGEDGLLRIWNFKTGNLLNAFQNESPLNSIAKNQDFLFLGNAKGEIQILVFNKKNNELNVIYTFKAHHGIVRCLKIEQNLLISGGEDSKVNIWNLVTLKCVQTISHNNFVQDILVEGGNIISVSYDGEILISKLISQHVF